MNTKKTKKFWKIIKEIIDPDDSVDIISYVFKDLVSGDIVEKCDIPDYLNNYFVNIAERTRNRPVNAMYDFIDVQGLFDFVLPTVEEIYGYMIDIDINSSSCIKGISSNVCKTMLDSIPSKFCHLFANSLFFGKFPTDWTRATVTLIPKDGNKNEPGNWRPISETILFAKILEKIVHRQMLKYLFENNILTNYQYGFLPGKSTQEAVF